MSSEYSSYENNYLLKVGNRIKESRLSLNLSQEKFAQLSGLDRTYISDVERGRRNLSLLTLLKIAKTLNTLPQDLVKK